jgi:hypothetical protein
MKRKLQELNLNPATVALGIRGALKVFLDFDQGGEVLEPIQLLKDLAWEKYSAPFTTHPARDASDIDSATRSRHKLYGEEIVVNY